MAAVRVALPGRWQQCDEAEAAAAVAPEPVSPVLDEGTASRRLAGLGAWDPVWGVLGMGDSGVYDLREARIVGRIYALRRPLAVLLVADVLFFAFLLAMALVSSVDGDGESESGKDASLPFSTLEVVLYLAVDALGGSAYEHMSVERYMGFMSGLALSVVMLFLRHGVTFMLMLRLAMLILASNIRTLLHQHRLMQLRREARTIGIGAADARPTFLDTLLARSLDPAALDSSEDDDGLDDYAMLT